MDDKMPSFHNGSVELSYLDEGEGDPIVLVHGFASSKNVNWAYPGWTSVLTKAGRRVIVTTAELVHVDDQGVRNPCAVMQQTLMPVPKTY